MDAPFSYNGLECINWREETLPLRTEVLPACPYVSHSQCPVCAKCLRRTLTFLHHRQGHAILFFFFFFPKWLHLTASSFCQNMGTAVLSDQQAFTNKCLYILLHCQELHVYFASHLRYWPVRQDWNLAWFPLSSPGEVFNFWISSQHQWETRKGVLFIQISWQELMWTGHSCF